MIFSAKILLAALSTLALPLLIQSKGIAETQRIESINQNKNVLYRESLALFEARDYKSAIQSLTNYLEKDSSSHHAHFLRGRCYHELGILDKANADYKKAIEINPSSSYKSYNNSGLIYGELKSFELAKKSFTKAIKVNPQAKEAYNNRGVAKAASGDTNGAIRDFTKSINIDRNYLEPVLNRSFVFEMQGKLSKACSDWKKASRMGSRDATTWHKFQCKNK